MATLSDEDVQKLWKQYHKQHSLPSKHKLIMNYIWLVKYVLQTMNLPMNTLLAEEDFLNIGILGLNESIDRFEPERQVKFESYAIPRIKGTIQDELRKLDWLSRTARKKATDFLQAGDQLRSKAGREVSSEEIREKLNVTHEEYQTYLAAAAAAKASFTLAEPMQSHNEDDDKDYIEELPDTAQESTLHHMENEERLNYVLAQIKSLNDKKRMVVTLYYYENLTFREIGKVLSISESRVCQIHTQVLADMRLKLTEFDNA